MGTNAPMGSPWEVRVNLLHAALHKPKQFSWVYGIRPLRVPDFVRTINPEVYVPQLLFLGFLNRPDPAQDLGIDRFKVEWARQFLAWRCRFAASGGASPSAADGTRSYEQQWQEFVASLQIDVGHAYQMYGIQPSAIAPQVVEDVLALDSLFLCLVLCAVYSYEEALPGDFFGKAMVAELKHVDPFRSCIRDIFLVENQLPLYILQRVISGFSAWVRRPDWAYDLIENVLYDRFCSLFPEGETDDGQERVLEAICDYVKPQDGSNHHLLQCLLRLVCHAPQGAGYSESANRAGTRVKCASLLNSVGIRVTTAAAGCWLPHCCQGCCSNAAWRRWCIVCQRIPGLKRLCNWDPGREGPVIFLHQMRFDKAGSRLLVPSIRVKDDTEGLLRNLAACEQQHADRGPTHFVSYLELMDDLIDTGEDVHLLGKYKVLRDHSLGTDAGVADMWNTLTTNLISQQSVFLASIVRDVDARYENVLRKLFAEFWSIYLSRPWYTISFLAAFVLLGLTVTQTVCLFNSCV